MDECNDIVSPIANILDFNICQEVEKPSFDDKKGERNMTILKMEINRMDIESKVCESPNTKQCYKKISIKSSYYLKDRLKQANTTEKMKS